jgi:CheY-like chemotaxis protein
LAICKAYSSLLSGNIGVISESGKGSEFFFSIPYKPAKEKKDTISPDIPIDYNFSGKQILLVEDDPISALFLQEFLSDTGALVVRAEDGRQALQMFDENKFLDIVLLDIQLPELSGYQVAREMKIRNDKIPIIAQTAYASLDDKKKCLLAGCVDYVRKPVDAEELLSKMNAVFIKGESIL